MLLDDETNKAEAAMTVMNYWLGRIPHMGWMDYIADGGLLRDDTVAGEEPRSDGTPAEDGPRKDETAADDGPRCDGTVSD